MNAIVKTTENDIPTEFWNSPYFSRDTMKFQAPYDKAPLPLPGIKEDEVLPCGPNFYFVKVKALWFFTFSAPGVHTLIHFDEGYVCDTAAEAMYLRAISRKTKQVEQLKKELKEAEEQLENMLMTSGKA